MYIYNLPNIKYIDPWMSSFEHRLNVLKRAKQWRVAYYYESPDSSTFRYRVYNMIQALSASTSGGAASYFWGEELEQMDKIISNTDVIVICRARYTEQLNRFVTKARNMGKRVFFDIDDLVYNPIFAHLVIDALNADITNSAVSDFWFSFTGQQAAALNLCEYVITTNDYLASCIKRHTGKSTFVIPNFLNREQIEVSAHIFEAKQVGGFQRDDKFHLGYFSGSPTHAKDLGVALDAIIDLLEKHKNLVLRIVGYMDLVKPLQKYSSQVERYPMQDFLNLQRLIGEVEVNLVPLQNNEFTNCKSELKYFEAGLVGTVSIASPTFTYSNAIQNGDNGFLAKSYEWYEKIEALIAAPSSLVAIAERSQAASEKRYAWHNQVGLIEKTLFSSEKIS